MKNFISILLLASFQLFAQDLQKEAQEKFSNQEWNAAIKAYNKYLKKQDSDSSAWYNLGYSYLQLKDYSKALNSYKEAANRNFNSSFTTFSIAKVHALMGNLESLLTALNQGIENGFAAYTSVLNDAAFDPYRDSPKFQEALEKVKLNAYPCLSSEDYRHFDFWLGEWDVYANGRKVGENSITMAKGGCAIHESYTTARNYAGQSINFYDPIDKKWHQHWVGSSGDTYNYIETKRKEGLLQFESDFLMRSGQIGISRLTFTLNDDGTVRQLFENSTDGGKTWSPAFDGLYKKKVK